jgi:hypothetical protein
MKRTKPQHIDPKQVKQFLADARKKSVAARKNLAIDAETAYQVAYEAMLKGSLGLDAQPRPTAAGTTRRSHRHLAATSLGVGSRD